GIDRVEHARRRARLAAHVDRVDLVAVPARDEPVLEGERAGRRDDERPQLGVGRGQERRVHGERACRAPRERRERLAVAERLGADEVQAEIAVAELEPVRAVEQRHGLEGVPRLAGATPTAPLVCDAGQRVEHAVEVGRHAEAEELEVVADIHDGSHALAAERLDERANELRAAEAAAQREDLHARTSSVLRVFGPTCGARRSRSSRVSTSSRKPGSVSRRKPKRAALPGPYSGRNSRASASASALVVPSAAATRAGAAATSSSGSLGVTQGRAELTIAPGPPSAASAAATASPWPPGASHTITSPTRSHAARTSMNIASASSGSPSRVFPSARKGTT